MSSLPPLSDLDLHQMQTPLPERGFGALQTAHGCLPLTALDVHARLIDLVGEVEVRQTFFNPQAEPLEATYIFPLPERAAVTAFRFEVASRVIEGQLQERSQARREYDQAIQAGHRAAIAEEERSGVFTMRVGNLPPGERAIVRLTLVGPLEYRFGEVTFRFPLVVAPRYIPGTPLQVPPSGSGISPDTSAVPDASRISPPVLLSGFPNPVELHLSVTVDSVVMVPSELRSSLHAVVESRTSSGFRVELQPGERLDRDFILRYRLAGEQVGSSFLVRPDAEGQEGTFLLTLIPPHTLPNHRQPRSISFVLDRSGSMGGWKMVAARRAVCRMIETLTDEDRFTVYAFDNSIERPKGFEGGALMPASEYHRCLAVEFLRGIEARGGTAMAEPLLQAVEELIRDSGTQRQRLLVLITDGHVGNEDQILRKLGPNVAHFRIFTLGIDRLVNVGFLRRLADMTGGDTGLVESESRFEEVIDRIHRLIGTPILTELRFQHPDPAVQSESITPQRWPDLFSDVPLHISGRYQGAVPEGITLTARAPDGEIWSTHLAAIEDRTVPIDRIWARGRLRDLEDLYAIGTDRTRLEKEIVATSLRFGVLSRFTAYVAVDRAEIVNPGGDQKQQTQPVEMPSGWGATEERLVRSSLVDSAMLASPSRNPEHESNSLRPRRREIRRQVDPALLSEDSSSFTSASSGSLVGMVESVLGALFGTRTSKSPPTPETTLDHTVFRPRVEALRDAMRDLPVDQRARRASLDKFASVLGKLLNELNRAGENASPFLTLVTQHQQLVRLLQLPGTFDELKKLSEEIEHSLDEWLRLVATSPDAPTDDARREFWK